jgi:DNA-binding transcriptional ArsR family regulator
MTTKTGKNKLEISSDQLKAELIEIKERIGALETIATVSNRAVVEQHVRSHVKTPQAKQIMRETSEPRTREYLIQKLNFNSPAALDYHLTPLRENNLIHQHFDDDGAIQTFETSKLFRQLTKKVQKEILDGSEKVQQSKPGRATATSGNTSERRPGRKTAS